MIIALFVFVVLAIASIGGGLLLLAEGRRTTSLVAGYLGVSLALSGVMLLGGGVFASIFLFSLSMSTALVFLFVGVRIQGRGGENFDSAHVGRLVGKIVGSFSVLAIVVLLASLLPIAESREVVGVATAEPDLLGRILFGESNLLMLALGLIFLASATGALALVMGRSES